MSEETIRSVLRLVSVLIVVLATVMIVPSVVSSFATDGSGPGAQLAAVAAGMRAHLLWSYLVTVACGVALYLLSPMLARLVVK